MKAQSYICSALLWHFPISSTGTHLCHNGVLFSFLCFCPCGSCENKTKSHKNFFEVIQVRNTNKSISRVHQWWNRRAIYVGPWCGIFQVPAIGPICVTMGFYLLFCACANVILVRTKKFTQESVSLGHSCKEYKQSHLKGSPVGTSLCHNRVLGVQESQSSSRTWCPVLELRPQFFNWSLTEFKDGTNRRRVSQCRH